jgi:hypothetical protein
MFARAPVLRHWITQRSLTSCRAEDEIDETAGRSLSEIWSVAVGLLIAKVQYHTNGAEPPRERPVIVVQLVRVSHRGQP